MNPKELAQSPNTSPDELFLLVASYPRGVLQNPVLPLISLERPVLYVRIPSPFLLSVSGSKAKAFSTSKMVACWVRLSLEKSDI
jgi:hypothetical protein